MTTLMDGHVRLNGQGVPYVGKTRLKLIHLIMALQSLEGSVERLQVDFAWLPKADLYGALAYYLDHQEAVEDAIQAYQQKEASLPAESAQNSALLTLVKDKRRAS